jgi:hypothetical protein
MLGYIRGTTTMTGLTVSATFDEDIYRKGQKIAWQDVDGLNIEYHTVCSEWKYTIKPAR